MFFEITFKRALTIHYKMKRNHKSIAILSSEWRKCAYVGCDFYGRSDNVKRHELTHLPADEKPRHICQCGMVLSTKGALTRHKKFSCRLMNEVQEESSSIVQQEMLSTVQPEVPPTAAEIISFDDFEKLEYVITLKNGSTIRVPGLVEDIPKLLNIEPAPHDALLSPVSFNSGESGRYLI